MEAWNPVDFESGDLPPSSPYFHARLHGLLSSAQRFRDQMHPLIGEYPFVLVDNNSSHD